MRKTPLCLVAIALLPLLLPAGCASPRPEPRSLAVVSVREPSLRLPNGGSYSWAPSSGVFNADRRLDNRFAEELFRAAVAAALARRDFVEAAGPESGDVIVAYWGALENALDDDALAERFGISPGLGSLAPDGRYEKGTLGIDLIDPGSHRTIWRGVLQGYVDYEIDDIARRQRTEAAVERIFRALPAAREDGSSSP